MKSLALRVCALIVLGGMAHALKPFTSENLTSYATVTAHSLATWLPTAAAARLENTAALASVLNTVWQTPNRPGWMEAEFESMLAVARLQPEQPPLTLLRASQSRVAKARVRATAAESFSPEATDIEEAAEPEEVVADAAEETINKLLQRATVAVPLPVATVSLPVLLNKSRAACPMPSVVGTEEPVSAPEALKAEGEAEAGPAVEPMVEAEAPSAPTLQRRVRLPLEVEFAPISLRPTSAPMRSLIKRASTIPAKC